MLIEAIPASPERGNGHHPECLSNNQIRLTVSPNPLILNLPGYHSIVFDIKTKILLANFVGLTIAKMASHEDPLINEQEMAEFYRQLQNEAPHPTLCNGLSLSCNPKAMWLRKEEIPLSRAKEGKDPSDSSEKPKLTHLDRLRLDKLFFEPAFESGILDLCPGHGYRLRCNPQALINVLQLGKNNREKIEVNWLQMIDIADWFSRQFLQSFLLTGKQKRLIKELAANPLGRIDLTQLSNKTGLTINDAIYQLGKLTFFKIINFDYDYYIEEENHALLNTVAASYQDLNIAVATSNLKGRLSISRAYDTSKLEERDILRFFGPSHHRTAEKQSTASDDHRADVVLVQETPLARPIPIKKGVDAAAAAANRNTTKQANLDRKVAGFSKSWPITNGQEPNPPINGDSFFRNLRAVLDGTYITSLTNAQSPQVNPTAWSLEKNAALQILNFVGLGPKNLYTLIRFTGTQCGKIWSILLQAEKMENESVRKIVFEIKSWLLFLLPPNLSQDLDPANITFKEIIRLAVPNPFTCIPVSDDKLN